MRHRIDRPHSQSGLTSAVSLVGIVVSLAVVAILVLVGMNAFGGGTATGSSIVSTSQSETQLKLCAEGRASTYGDPPTPAQQAACLNRLAGQISGGSPSAPASP
jgi:type II secretory pathway pseudopilin PulG